MTFYEGKCDGKKGKSCVGPPTVEHVTYLYCIGRKSRSPWLALVCVLIIFVHWSRISFHNTIYLILEPFTENYEDWDPPTTYPLGFNPDETFVFAADTIIHPKNEGQGQSSTEDPSDSSSMELKSVLKVINKLGKDTKTVNNFDVLMNKTYNAIWDEVGPAKIKRYYLNASIIDSMRSAYEDTWRKGLLKRENGGFFKFNTSAPNSRTRITVAAIACGDRFAQTLLMLQSAAIFSQHAALHVVVFSDAEAILSMGDGILRIKWIADALGWQFTYELHLEWFPHNRNPKSKDVVNWKDMYTKCATQRLFFPSLLPHIDALIYLDSDTLVISNLTELWQEMPEKMGGFKLAAAAANTEDAAGGIYGPGGHVPYFGKRGLNAGIMLMNLTQMRDWDFQERAIKTQSLYKKKIQFADQDIINIIFNKYPEKLLLLDCSYNFNWIHCGGPDYTCYNQTSGENFCFCGSVKTDGVKVLHGNGGTFGSDYFQHSFLAQAYNAFKKLDLLEDNYTAFIADLKRSFDISTHPPCAPLSSDLLYSNALHYLQNLEQF